ncbi:MAG TPA: hypothetical protein DCY79_09420 [Planctomycetaceae bacterium]|nr:hypothetical protein [Blastopirellula sp.]HAY80007.1 hypothetical protein [Planctomycetaceae bacterium]
MDVPTSDLNTQDLSPYVLYRIDDEGLQCAMWRLQDGRETLALFLDEAAAGEYAKQAGLAEGWRAFQPNRRDLLEMIRQAVASGVKLAALDPDQQQAKRLFDLAAVLTKMAPD